MADEEIRSKSAFLCLYMTNHPDTLAAYVMHATKQKNVRDCLMKSIDAAGMDMEYKLKGRDETQRVRISFDPPLQGYAEVRPRLLAMKTDAEEAIGMVKRPKLDVYYLPDPLYLAVILPLEALLIYCSLAGRGTYAETIRRFTGGWTIIYLAWAFVFVAHGGEAYFAYKLCRRSQMGAVNTFLWTFSTYLVGVASLLTLKRIITNARIASVSKAQ